MHRIRWSRLAVAAASASRRRLRRGSSERSASGRRRRSGRARSRSASSTRARGCFRPTARSTSRGCSYGPRVRDEGHGKVNGRKIEITAVDDGTDPAKAVTAAKDLIGKGYKIIGGSVSIGRRAPDGAARRAEPRPLHLRAGGDRRHHRANNRYTFRSGRQTIPGHARRQAILGKGVGKKIIVFAQDSAFGHGNVAAVEPISAGAATPSAACSCRSRRRTSRRTPSGRSSRTPTCSSSPGPAPPRPRCGARSTSRASSALDHDRHGLAERATWATYVVAARSTSSRTTSTRRRRTRSTTGWSRR